MKGRKDNVIYIDFTFKRKKIKSKHFFILYKLYAYIRNIFSFYPKKTKGKKSNYVKKYKSSNY